MTTSSGIRRRLRARLRRRDGDLCCWCHKPMLFADGKPGVQWSPLFATIEHIIPRCSGGSDDEDNLALAHRLCNQRRDKGASIEALEAA